MKTDKAIAYTGILALFGCGADLMARGVDSLYGRFFVWLVSVAS